jgi:tRNA nucleotidyltransferase (CCA-adding enzyme)
MEKGEPQKAVNDLHRGSEPLTVITTHINADFDALASMLAAQKLYPGALVVFPGSQEKNLRDFFIQSMVYLYNLAEVKDIDMTQVQRLVLVDTRRADRIGKLSEVLENAELDIHIYDHHTSREDDVKGRIEVCRRTGATVTILTEIIRSKNLPITPEEATILCLGIYEDTGSFTFTSTTPEDLETASFLLSRGANLDIIANLISREISPEQVGYLNDLIQNATHYTVNGVEIVITSITLDQYLPDFAFLIHKMAKMEDADAIFALAMMESKIYIVARSRTADADVGAIVSALGGGGHPSAAAAAIKGQTLPQVEHALFKELTRSIRSQRQADQLMSSPAISIHADINCDEANKKLTRYNINALLVVSDDTQDLLGYITRQVIEKAIHHDLGRAPVRDYMTTEIATVTPDANLAEIQDKIIELKQRVLPVIADNKIVGVITRTDLLNVLVQQTHLARGNTPDPHKAPLAGRIRNISNFMQERLVEKLMRTLQRVGSVADDLAFQAYVVGGFVRDLFLYRGNEDVDIVIEGDGIDFAREFARRHKARIHSHKAFGTAVIIFEDGFKIDVATARLEYYRSPAALPDVEMSSIKLDLYRRDFTINTLAIQLNADRFGNLIDFFSAQKDIKDKAVRVLHNLSFVEDPTRVFRAIRFEQRFGFTIGKLTANLIDNAVRMDFFKRLSGRRVFAEIRLILEEENPSAAILRMHDFDLLKVIHDSIIVDQNLIGMMNSVKNAITWHDLLFVEEPYLRWAVYFMALIHRCDLSTCMEICEKMELAPRYRKLLCSERLNALKCLSGMEYNPPKSASELYRRLHGFRTELILYMMASTRNRSIKKSISIYYNQLKDVQPLTSGRDLLSMGLKPGPVFRQILEAVLDARLNGEVETHHEESEFIRRWIRKHSTQ